MRFHGLLSGSHSPVLLSFELTEHKNHAVRQILFRSQNNNKEIFTVAAAAKKIWASRESARAAERVITISPSARSSARPARRNSTRNTGSGAARAALPAEIKRVEEEAKKPQVVANDEEALRMTRN